MIFTSVTRSLMASFAIFPTVFNTYEKLVKDILIPKFVKDAILIVSELYGTRSNYCNWTSCRTIQPCRTIWPRASRSSHFEITRAITPFIKSILKSLVILAICLALSGAIYSRIAPFFALNRIFFSVIENGTVKHNNQSDSKQFV